VVDGADQYIESSSLGIWMQARPGVRWSAMSSVHWLDRKLFTAGLSHFSGYAVSH
jgi:alpha-D-ribose 1-methylphosphonate 5-triphosphate diphosphatase PhnM